MEIAISTPVNGDANNTISNNTEQFRNLPANVKSWTKLDCINFFDNVSTANGKVITKFEEIKLFEACLAMYFRYKQRRFKKKSSRYNKKTGKSQTLHYICYNYPKPKASLDTNCDCDWRCVTGRTGSLITITQWEPIEKCKCEYVWNSLNCNTVREMTEELYGTSSTAKHAPRLRVYNSEWSAVVNAINTLQRYQPTASNRNEFRIMTTDLRTQLMKQMEPVLTYVKSQRGEGNEPIIQAVVEAKKKRKSENDIADKSKTKRKVVNAIKLVEDPRPR